MEEIAIGIDAGTSNSVIGTFQNFKVEIAPNSIGDTYTPSVVDILDEGELVGEETMIHKIDENNSKNRITEIKRIIGRKFSSLTQQEKDIYNAVEDPKNTDQILVKVIRKGQEEFLSPEKIMSFIFKKLINIGSNFIGTKIKKAVITLPAYYDYNQRGAISESAKLAGIEVMRVLSEPIAAALAYGLGKTSDLKDSLAVSIMKEDKKTNRKIMVFDLGGGTFDLSILSFNDNKEFIVSAKQGDTHLGGNDFDYKLADFCIQKFCNVYKIDESEIRSDKNVLRRLKIQCEKAKKKLSFTKKTAINMYNFFNNLNLYVDITREEFDLLCEDLYEKIKVVLDKILLEIKLSPEQIDDIVMIGGSSRIPKIKNILIEKFGEQKIRDQINPDEAVAIGATWQAHKILKSDKDINIVDITPFSLGVAAKSKNPVEQTKGSIMSILIPKNKPVSCRSDVHWYKTAEDNQKYFKIQLYAGEDRFCKNNDLLKEFEINNLPKGKKGEVSLKISLEINKDGILYINAEVESIGKKITEQYSLYEKTYQETENKARKRAPRIKGKEKLDEIKEINDYMNEKRQLLETLEDNGQKMKCLQFLYESCEKLISIYSELIEQNDSDNLYQKLIENYKRILKYYSDMIIICDEKNDKAIIEDLINNKIKGILSKLINDDIENMVNIFDNLKEKKPEKFCQIIILMANLLYDEGEKILKEGKNYARYYARKYFAKAEKIKSNIDQKLKENMDLEIQKLYNELEKNYVNKVGQIDAFVKSVQLAVKQKDTPYVTGFTTFGEIIKNAMEPENIYLALDIFSDMVDSLSQGKNLKKEEVFCLVNIIKIKFSILKNQTLNDIKNYENLFKRIDYILERIDYDEKESWYKEYEILVDEIAKKKEDLISPDPDKILKIKKLIEELKNIYNNKIKENKPFEFIDFIIKTYPFYCYDPSKYSFNGMSLEKIKETIYPKYHPDNYTGRDDFEIYNNIYMLLDKMNDDLRKKKK